jgi:hypothetical protein
LEDCEEELVVGSGVGLDVIGLDVGGLLGLIVTGLTVGCLLGLPVTGLDVGCLLGLFVTGFNVGDLLGLSVIGLVEGDTEGCGDGALVAVRKKRSSKMLVLHLTMRQMRRLNTRNILRNLRASVGFLEGDEEGSTVGLEEGAIVTGLWVGCLLGLSVTVEVLVAIDVDIVVVVASLLLVDNVDVVPPWLLALQSSITKHSSPATPNKLFSQHSSALSKK